LIEEGTYLPYATIYSNLARLRALQRLVVIDACRAEAIHDDPIVERIRQNLDYDSFRSRTAYLLATGPGEMAGEAPEIGHGLMTYVLLTGLGDDALKPPPGGPLANGAVTADVDGNQIITTDELRRFVQTHLPSFSKRFPMVVQRSGIEGGGLGLRLPPSPPSKVQGEEASFDLVAVPNLPKAHRTAAGPAPRTSATEGTGGPKR
jgi:hypothetical protein